MMFMKGNQLSKKLDDYSVLKLTSNVLKLIKPNVFLFLHALLRIYIIISKRFDHNKKRNIVKVNQTFLEGIINNKNKKVLYLVREQKGTCDK